MPQFDYCPPFEVHAGEGSIVKPLLETHSLPNALAFLRTRESALLTIRMLVTEGQVSTLVPVALSSSDLDGKDNDELTTFIRSSAELRFRSLSGGAAASASGV